MDQIFINTILLTFLILDLPLTYVLLETTLIRSKQILWKSCKLIAGFYGYVPWIFTNIPWKRIFIGILLQKRILSHSRRSTGRDRYYIVCTYYLMQEFKPRSKGPVAEFWIGRFFFQLDQVGGWTNNACNFFQHSLQWYAYAFDTYSLIGNERYW